MADHEKIEMSVKPDEIDIYSAEFQNDFYQYYPVLRKEGDIVLLSKSKCYAVFKYDIAKDILNNAADFTSGHLKTTDSLLVGADGEIHSTNKKIIFQELSLLKSNHNPFDNLMDDILNRLYGEVKNLNFRRFNAVDYLVNPFTLTAIFSEFGFLENRENINLFSTRSPFVDKISRIKEIFSNWDLVNEIVADHLQNDSISPELKRIVQKINVNNLFNEEDILKFLRLFSLAGIETTSSLIASCVYTLHNLSPLNDELLKNDDSMKTAFINEVLRLYSPAQFTFRLTARDVIIGDKPVPKDSLIAVSIGAANRDPSVFPDPSEFSLNRKNQHIAFGSGKHKCVGERTAFSMASKFLDHYIVHIDQFEMIGDRKMRNSIFSYKISEINIEEKVN